jgi:lysophospholipase L1-like esterase
MTVSPRRKGRALGIAAAAIAALLSVPFGVAGAVSASPSNVTQLVTIGDSIAAGKGKPGGGHGNGGGGTAQLSYAALGDSYAAGVGAGSYLENTCYTSSKGYPALLDADANLALVVRPACKGATTTDVSTTQVAALPATAARVTLTVGGNDVGFANVMQNCFVLINSSCESHIIAGETLVSNGTLGANVTNAIAAIRAKAPAAKIVVTGYPLLFDPTSSYRWASRVNTGTIALNDAIQAVAVANGAVFVDVEVAFAGHGIGSASPWINDWNWLRQVDSFHANAAGYSAIATAIRPLIG